jgi:hypothetical protein
MMTATEMTWCERLEPGTPAEIERGSRLECRERRPESIVLIVDNLFRHDCYYLRLHKRDVAAPAVRRITIVDRLDHATAPVPVDTRQFRATTVMLELIDPDWLHSEMGWMPANAQVQLQGKYHHRGVAASIAPLPAATSR